MKQFISLLLAMALFAGFLSPIAVNAEETAIPASTASTETVVETETAEETQPAAVTEAVVETEPVETAEAVEGTEPVETTETVAETEPVETTEAAAETEPAETTEAVVETEPAAETEETVEPQPTDSTIPVVEDSITQEPVEASTASEQYLKDLINQGKKQIALDRNIVLEGDFELPQDVFVQFNGYTIRVSDGTTMTVYGQLGYWFEQGGLTVEGNGTLYNYGFIGTSGFVEIWGNYEGGGYVHTAYTIGGFEPNIYGLDDEYIWMHYVVDTGNPKADHQDLFMEYLNLMNSTNYGAYSLQLHGNMTLRQDIVIPVNCSFHLESYPCTLTISAGCKITNYGDFYVWDDQTVLNYGTFDNFGYLNISGSWQGNQPAEPKMTQDHLEEILSQVRYGYYLDREVVLDRNMTLSGKWLDIGSGGKLVVPKGVKLTLENSIWVYVGGSLNIQGSYEVVQSEGEHRAIYVFLDDGVFSNVTGVKQKDMDLICGVYTTAQLKKAFEKANTGSYQYVEIYVYANATTPGSAVIPKNCSVYVTEDIKLTIPSGHKLVNNGSLCVWDRGTLQNSGVIESDNYIYVGGKLYNYGKITVKEQGLMEVFDGGRVTNQGTVTAYGPIVVSGTWEGSEPVKPHVHHYTAVVTYPTCTKKGYTTYTCSCGNSYKSDYTDPTGHDYYTTVTAPTCNKKGYAVYTCYVCGDTYKTENAPALGHDFDGDYCTVCGIHTSEVRTLTRIAGDGRCQTAMEAAEELKKIQGVNKFQTILVADGNNYPDALSGSYLAAVADAPILLVQANQKKVTQTVKEYILGNLTADATVYILGGTNSIPTDFERSIASAGYTVKRLAGNDRYLTSLMIIQEGDALLAQQGKAPADSLLVCAGGGYADSLSASATGRPVLLVNGGKTALTTSQKNYLDSIGKRNIYIIGGPNSVSNAIATQLNAYDTDGITKRIAGDGREETSAKVAQEFFPNATFAVLADGNNYPDGLSGGPVAYAKQAPLLLIRAKRESHAKDFVGNRIKEGCILGGPNSVSDDSVIAIFGENALIK